MKRFIEILYDENRPLNERIFILMAATIFAVMTAMLAFAYLMHEDAVDLATIAGCVAVFSVVVLLGIYYGRINLAATIIAVIVILILLPVTFFTGGGILSGSPIWFIFCTLFINLAVEGKRKPVLIAMCGISAAICYAAAFRYPGLVAAHSMSTAYIESLFSVLIVGILLSFMYGFEIMVLKRAMDQSMEKSRKIEALNQSQNRFFSSMSHEIRTPINTIIGLNEIILREDISKEVAENAQNIQSASKILLSVINDILDMSKIESGKMEIVPVSYDVRSMIDDMINMTWNRAREKGLEFGVDIDPSIPARLFADEIRIRQILINLLNNAIKYTQEGSILLSVHCRRSEPGKAIVTYTVDDTGMGIKKENIPFLFNAYQRLDEEKNKYIEGTGLGLSIVKQLVDLMGGEISVHSVYTKGTTFAVTIEQEIVDETVIGKVAPENMRLSRIGNPYRQHFEAPEARVLIVDDNSANLLVATKLLRQTKVETVTVQSAKECLELTMKSYYHVILMDHMMPEMDGIECLHAIRDQAGGLCREVPVVVVTANAGSENQALYRREGFDDYLVKPLDAADLEHVLYSLLPKELVTVMDEEDEEQYEANQIIYQMRKRVPLLVTTESAADLPAELTERLGIPVIPYTVHTDTGIFTDGQESESTMLLNFIQDTGMTAKSMAPTVADYEDFFAQHLTQAQHIVHISMGKRISKGFTNANEAALSFYNVRVIDSGHLSSGMGLLALAAHEYAGENQANPQQAEELIAQKRDRIHTSFMPGSTLFLYRAGLIPGAAHRCFRALRLHPVLVVRESTLKLGGIMTGSMAHARDTYIRNIFRTTYNIDTRSLFITYAGMKRSDLEEIKDKVLSIVSFDEVYFQKASSAVAVNCGPQTFGFIFARK